ncbi:MAG: transcription antitermination factor NusB [Elusimicrobia bacterium]|nr:transcription antitermination factor NusB [Elusimicrobiota bacterium]MDE2236506.1 transcription antitermination factor NusB [Elusimicrobiota bacterium]MDE2424678.1 transcription antitermination factor NusB [Elusimicrobiota bacterium]
MGRRRQAREIALQALYIIDTSGTAEEEAFAIVNRREEPGDEATLGFARELLRGATLHRPELDRLIEGAAQNWALGRMAAVDRNVLRLSAFELLHRLETPVNVVIDEAIEIVRKYSTEDSTRFINGILDTLKEHRK